MLASIGLVILAAAFRPVVQGDGVGYYSYLHAVLVSHSLDFGNEYSAGSHVAREHLLHPRSAR